MARWTSSKKILLKYRLKQNQQTELAYNEWRWNSTSNRYVNPIRWHLLHLQSSATNQRIPFRWVRWWQILDFTISNIIYYKNYPINIGKTVSLENRNGGCNKLQCNFIRIKDVKTKKTTISLCEWNPTRKINWFLEWRWVQYANQMEQAGQLSKIGRWKNHLTFKFDMVKK